MKKIYQYILMAVAMIATASCSNELEDTLQPADSGNLQFVVSDFPAFGEGAQTRAIGLQDEGKTSWEDGDVIFIHLYSSKYGNQTATLTFKAEEPTWSSEGTLSYLENETPTVTAVYAPGCEIKDGQIVLQNGNEYGMAEYILASTNIADNTLQIEFEPGRTYSRLRIAATANEEVTVTTTGFTPTGPEGATVPESYTLTADDKGNAYLYGTFAANGTVTVKNGDVELKNYEFTAPTGEAVSYVLDVRPLYVDLGLESKTLWATRNVGADNPWDYGDYFAWGETSPKDTYTWDNYKWGTENNLTKYNSTDNKTALDTEDDAATVNMGTDWCMPTSDNWTELMNNCTWTKITLDGVNGYTIVGSNGNSIFLPAAGNAERYKESQGQYWTTNIESETNTNSKYFTFSYNYDMKVLDHNNRYRGLSVRAVKKQ